jgi:hypothetical protein
VRALPSGAAAAAPPAGAIVDLIIVAKIIVNEAYGFIGYAK